MSMCKSSMITGALDVKTVNWTEVPDEELVTDINDMDSVGDVKAWEKRRRMHAACDAEIWRAEEARQEAKWKHQAEEAEKCWKEEEKRKREAKERKQAAAAEARKQQQVDSEAQASGSWMNTSICIRCARLRLTCSIPVGVKKRLACGSCMKAKERCKWPEVEMMASRAGTSPRGREHKKWAKKAADDDDDDNIVILSGWKIKQQGGGKTLKEISDQWWGELIQAVSSHMDAANGHLEKIQQVLLLKLVEIASTAGSGGSKEVVEDPEELQEAHGGESGGQEDETEGVPGEGLGGAPEDALGEEPENSTGAEDGAGEGGQENKAKDKGKEKAL
ncbi:hypothetical protein ID866_11717 [Astraeus odoratus]|nr:hypothetical protein ID866_11717 [Astraeus odoratus]